MYQLATSIGEVAAVLLLVLGLLLVNEARGSLLSKYIVSSITSVNVCIKPVCHLYLACGTLIRVIGL